MTLKELISLFIPKGHFFQGAKLSKIALPFSKATTKKEKRTRESEVLLK